MSKEFWHGIRPRVDDGFPRVDEGFRRRFRQLGDGIRAEAGRTVGVIVTDATFKITVDNKGDFECISVFFEFENVIGALVAFLPLTSRWHDNLCHWMARAIFGMLREPLRCGVSVKASSTHMRCTV